MILSVNLFMTLDGVSQGPGSDQEDTRDNFTSGGWLMPYFDEGCGKNVDLYRFLIAPVVVGRGSRIFHREGPATGMSVVHREVTESGVIALDLKPKPFRNNLVPIVENGREVMKDRDAE